MNNVFSIFFSAIEFSSLLILTLCSFRFNIKLYVKEIIIVSIVMSIISFFFAWLNIVNIYPIIQLIILIIVFKFVFKESFFYSFVSNVLGFVLFNFIELTSFKLFSHYQLVDTSALGGAANTTTYILQTVSALMVYVVAFGMKFLNQGFGYVDVGILSNRKIKTTNKYFLIVSSLAGTSLFFIFDQLLTSKDATYVTISVIVLIVSAIILIYLFNKRDNEQYR